MSDPIALHRDAMDLAEQATLASMRGFAADAGDLTRRAFAAELAAAEYFAGLDAPEPTRSVLHRSAASLAIEAREFRQAERLIARALAGNPPESIAEELRDLIEQVHFQRHLDLRGISLQPNEFQLSLAGKGVGYGIVESDQFVERVNFVETLLYRTAERQLRRPFRERGRKKATLKKELEIFVSVPRAASFAVSFRIGSNPQLALPELDFAQQLIDEMLRCFVLFDRGDLDGLKEAIPDPAYRRNFVGLARSIAPDGQEVASVGFSTFRNGEAHEVALTLPRGRVPQMDGEPQLLVPESQAPIRIRGTLRYADARKAEGEIQLVDVDGRTHKVRVPAGLMSDIVRPMWDDEVIVTGRAVAGVVELVSIEPAPDDPVSAS